MSTIETISSAIKSATDLDALREALLTADEDIRARREGDYSSDDPAEYVPSDDHAGLSDYCNVCDLRCWGDAPDDTEGMAAYSETHVLWLDGWTIEHRAQYSHGCPECGCECYEAENEHGEILVGDRLITPHTGGLIAAVRDSVSCPLCVDCYDDARELARQYGGLTYHVAPEDQGQIIEVAYAYAWDPDVVVVRATDRSDGSVTYREATLADGAEFEPWNGRPALTE